VLDSTGYIPVNIITGFLGSGKTTLLQHLLAAPALSDTAVLVNEFGEIGLDHHLLQRVDADIVLLQSGCLCCTIRGDLSTAIRDLYGKRERGEIAQFQRLAIETTGLADPVPILATVMAEPMISHHFRLGHVIATVDGVNGPFHLDRQYESVKQVAAADRIIVTKTDIASPNAVSDLIAGLRRLNPSATLFSMTMDHVPDAALLLTDDPYDPNVRGAEVQRWLAFATAAPNDDRHHRHAVNRHGDSIHAFCLTFEEPLDWTAFGIWLSMLLHSRGTDVLRVKGLLNVVGNDSPVVVHGVQHLVHPPVHLGVWPDGDRRSRLVFIVRDIAQSEIERSLAAFNRLTQPASAVERWPIALEPGEL
jgi:G3E family GTPase